jgi:NADH-ubiquinone oxidoreductase chain 2
MYLSWYSVVCSYGMLTITLVAILLAIPLSSSTISAALLTRITAVALLYAAALSYSSSSVLSVPTLDASLDTGLDAGLGLYSGLIHVTTLTQTMEVFLLLTGAMILLPWSATLSTNTAGSYVRASASTPSIPEYPMIILFSLMGATFLISSADLVSLYLAIELQSFGVYILAALYRDSESATAAGLKYFLLGALSSALILLGSALIYSYTGLTNLDSIYELLSVPSGDGFTQAVVLGFVLISVGFLFKVAAAPFHFWAPDVYDGTPTIVTTWLTVMPKISIFVLLLEMYRGTGVADVLQLGVNTNLYLVAAFLSLVVGTVVGLSQYRIKRLLTYSTISHVGFLLLALAVAGPTGAESVDALLFYIVQYSLTNLDAFFILLAVGYFLNSGALASSTGASSDIQFTSQLQGLFRQNPMLSISFALCLFSMAGVPPLVGFFGKYTVLYTAIHNGYVFLAIVGILASVVSAVYYLRIVAVLHFHAPTTVVNETQASATLTSVHSYVIATLTLFIVFFALNPTLILNSTSLMALSLYTT